MVSELQRMENIPRWNGVIMKFFIGLTAQKPIEALLESAKHKPRHA
jgi:hypothetical protein